MSGENRGLLGKGRTMVCAMLVVNGLLPLLYLALLMDYGATFFMRTRTHVRTPWLGVVLGIHAALIVLRGVHEGHPPLASAADILSAVALATAAVYALVELAGRDRRTGIFVLSLVFLMQYASTVLMAASHEAIVAEAASGWSRLHVLPAVVAYTAMGFAGVYGLLFLLAQRDLREHRFGMLFDRLPPLDLLGRMTWHALLVGFVFMTVTIATAPLLMGHTDGAADGVTAKVWAKIIAGSAAWLISTAAVLGGWLGKWPPSRIAGISLVGFVVVMVLLVASGLLS